MKKANYESPKMVFTRTELFENVAEECWANPSLYCLVDPTDEDENAGKNCNLQYADLVGFAGKANGNGCNDKMKKSVSDYLILNYGPSSEFAKTGHWLTGSYTEPGTDIYTIMESGGGNLGTPLKTSDYIHKVRS